MTPDTPTAQPVTRSKTGIILLWLTIPLFIVGLLVWANGWLFHNQNSGVQQQRENLLNQIANQPVIRHYDVPLLSNPFVVAPRQFHSWSFVVPPKCTAIKVDGHFSVTGGSGNDIEMYIVDDDGLVNAKNRHRFQAYYNSGRVTQGTLGITLPSDNKTYYLIFNNGFSFMSNKAVTADLKLHYDRSL